MQSCMMSAVKDSRVGTCCGWVGAAPVRGEKLENSDFICPARGPKAWSQCHLSGYPACRGWKQIVHGPGLLMDFLQWEW